MIAPNTMYTSLWVAVLGVLVSSGQCVRPMEDQDYDLDIRMPSVTSSVPDTLMCTSKELGREELYIVKFTPHASKETAHHLMIYGCEVPASQNKSWLCNEADGARSEHSVCGDGNRRQIIFAWALDAPDKSLPEGVGLRVSGTTGLKHLIVQLHYARTFSDGETDSSGVTLHVTHKRPAQQLGYYVLGSAGSVAPRQEDAHLETACRYSNEYTIYPIGYRTHSHSLGVVTAGYRIRGGVWTEIGRMSPQRPQTFYHVSNPGLDIRKGDILAARCTMNTMSRNEITYMGPTHRDEMCNFYIMYSTYYQEDLTTQFCFPENPDFSWANDLSDYLPPPKDVSSLQGIDSADYIKAHY